MLFHSPVFSYESLGDKKPLRHSEFEDAGLKLGSDEEGETVLNGVCPGQLEIQKLQPIVGHSPESRIGPV